MKNISTAAHRRRAAAGLAFMLLATVSLIASTGPALADPAPNNTPANAVGFASVPYDVYGTVPVDNPVASDPAGQLVATECNGGSAIYGTAWWKYTPASRSTFVVHAALAVSGPSVEEPIGMAVVAGGLGSVLKCGVEGSSISDAGAFTLNAGESLYIVTYYRAPTDPSIVAPHVGVYPSTGVRPGNDDFADATPITALPFTATQDTTMATREPSEPVCYNKFGFGPSVWYSVTVPTTRKLTVDISSDSGAYLVIASSRDDQSTWRCDGDTSAQFEAQAGVSYRIGIYGVDEVRNSGQVTINVAAVPVPPSITKFTIASTGTVNKKKGVVKLSGKVVCTGTTTTNPITGTLTQEYRRVSHTRAFTGSAAPCTGKSVTWKATVQPADFRFTTGKVKVQASVTACTSGGCVTSNAKRTVKLTAS